jgi:hypothetical protein
MRFSVSTAAHAGKSDALTARAHIRDTSMPERQTQARFSDKQVPGAGLPELEPTKTEMYNVFFEYGVLLGNFFMVGFVALWYYKKVAWTRDPGACIPQALRPLNA